MASFLCKFTVIPREFNAVRCLGCQHIQKRFIRRGKAHTDAKSFADRLADIKTEKEKDLIINNIGFPLKQPAIRQIKRSEEEAAKLEELARHGKLRFDLEEVNEKWMIENGAQFYKTIADHYGINRDLFNHCYFHPKFFMDINYDIDDNRYMPIYMGNVITPYEARMAPNVSYECDPDSLYTLILTSPDGNLQDNDTEFLHWMVGNIPGNDVKQGEVICNYMPPFPVRNVGFNRYVFVLYEQNQKMDYSKLQKPGDCLSLSERNFQTLDFYRERQDELTPASIGFYQSRWHACVTAYFRESLKMEEPIFEFIHPPPYHPEQKKYPHQQPFNLYLDRYRDIKELNEEALKFKLQYNNPFEKFRIPKYPVVFNNPMKPTWLKLKEKHRALKKHQWKDV